MEAAVSGMWSDCLARFDAMDQSAAILITTLASGEDELGGDSKLEDKGGGAGGCEEQAWGTSHLARGWFV